ncbi:MAG: hypothetical protein ACLRXQ_13160 [Phascolarctobacterium faecium]
MNFDSRRCLNILDKEQPEGVIAQFGGQTAINLAGPLADAGVKILGLVLTVLTEPKRRTF